MMKLNKEEIAKRKEELEKQLQELDESDTDEIELLNKAIEQNTKLAEALKEQFGKLDSRIRMILIGIILVFVILAGFVLWAFLA